MKKLFLILMTLMMSLSVIAQENVKQKEVGIVAKSFNSFGLTYKTGSNKSLWRFQTLLITGTNTKEKTEDFVRKRNNMGFGVQFGKEFRNTIVEKLEFRYGADLAFTYNFSKNEVDDLTSNDRDNLSKVNTYRPGINLVIGLNYVLKERFVIGVELLPYFNYVVEKNYSKAGTNEMENKDTGFNYGISNKSALLSLSVRF